MSSCEVESCERPVYARGLCARHDKQRQRHGAVQPDHLAAPCAVEACERRAVTRGWCHGHYLRWSRTGDVRAEVPLTRHAVPTCGVTACGRLVHSRGMCRAHVNRLLTTGQVRAEVPVREAGPGGSISHGYRKVVVAEDQLYLTRGERNVLEHRLVMASLLGRPLHPHEVVHHRNGDRLDNRPTNLELWTTAQPKGQRVADRLEHARELLALYEPDAASLAELRDDEGPPAATAADGPVDVPPSGFEPPLPP